VPNGTPAQLANLKPFQNGNMARRRSANVDRALREYRKLTPEAARFVGKVLRDEGEETRLRLKAAEIIALHGMPKGDAAKRALDGIEGVNSLRVEFVSADGSVVSFEHGGQPKRIAPAPGVIEVPFEVAKVSEDMDKVAGDGATASYPAPLSPSTDE
jgi:hypothetical protein